MADSHLWSRNTALVILAGGWRVDMRILGWGWFQSWGICNSPNLINIGAAYHTFLWVYVRMLSAFPSSLSPLVWNLLRHSKPPHVSPRRGAGLKSSIFTLCCFHLELPSSIPGAGRLQACLLFILVPRVPCSSASQSHGKLQQQIRVGSPRGRMQRHEDPSRVPLTIHQRVLEGKRKDKLPTWEGYLEYT